MRWLNKKAILIQCLILFVIITIGCKTRRGGMDEADTSLKSQNMDENFAHYATSTHPAAKSAKIKKTADFFVSIINKSENNKRFKAQNDRNLLERFPPYSVKWYQRMFYGLERILYLGDDGGVPIYKPGVYSFAGIGKSALQAYDLTMLLMIPAIMMDLSRNGLDDAFFDEVRGSALYRSHLRGINVSHNQLTNLSFLVELHRLEHVEASNNQLKQTGLTLRNTNPSNATYINLSHNPEFGEAAGCAPFKRVDEYLGAPWKIMDISYTGISCLSFITLSPILADNLTMLKIDGLLLDKAQQAGFNLSRMVSGERPYQLKKLLFLSATNLQGDYFPSHVFALNQTPRTGSQCLFADSDFSKPEHNCFPNLVMINLDGNTRLTNVDRMEKSGTYLISPVSSSGFKSTEALYNKEFCKTTGSDGSCTEYYVRCLSGSSEIDIKTAFFPKIDGDAKHAVKIVSKITCNGTISFAGTPSFNDFGSFSQPVEGTFDVVQYVSTYP